MSEQYINAELTKIIAPELIDSNYANSLEVVFNNINDNFIKLANREFVKGERGNTVEIKSIELYSNGSFTEIGQKLKTTIESLASDNEKSDIKNKLGETIGLWDYFKSSPEKIQMIYNFSDNETLDESKPVSSLYYIFLDGRYATKNIDESQYTNIKDLSCIAVYGYDEEVQDYTFKILSNAFPTMYYEEGLGLCWKINGNFTGIPVKGLKGENGEDSRLYIVKCNTINSNETRIKGEVSAIYSIYDGYINIEDYDDISILNEKTAIILTSDNETSGNLFYFGYLNIENDKLYAICEQETAINFSFNNEYILNIFKNINITSNDTVSSGLKGLFIPIEEEVDGKQQVHLLSSTSISNFEGSKSNKKNDLILTPINNINSLQIDDSNKLQVDKYLYVKINKEDFNIFSSLNSDIVNEDNVKKYDYVLKYKLTDIIKSKDSRYFDVISSNNTEGSRVFGKLNINSETIEISESNVKYYNNLGEQTSNHFDSMPDNFINKLNENNTGIYRWVLDNSSASYDVTELTSSNDETYNFPSAFNVIYTTTINPSINSEFLWFNGISLVNSAEELGYPEDSNNDNGFNNNTPIVYGWNTTGIYKALKFVKFVPIYSNDFKTEDDTALNINYNVNITGDSINSERNITVHGSVNCDNLNVYELTATGEIKNIYTKDTIVGDSGIKLSKSDSGEHLFTVENDGDVIVKSTVRANCINCTDLVDGENINYESTYGDEKNSVIANNIIATDSVKSTSLSINEVNTSNEYLSIKKSNSDNIDEYTIDTNINNVRNINIEGGDVLSVISSNIPTISEDKGTIIVSNQSHLSDKLYYRNNELDEPLAGITDCSSFESVRNYNLNDLAKSINSNKIVNNTVNYTSNCIEHLTNSDSSNYQVNEYLCKAGDTSWVNNNSLTAKSSANFITGTLTEPIISGYTKNYIENNYACYINIDTDITSSVKLNKNENTTITWSFDSDLQFHIGAFCQKNERNKWPILMSDSKLQLSVWYIPNNSQTPIYIPISNGAGVSANGTMEFTFDYTANNTNTESYSWKGFTKSGVKLNDDTNITWRYYAFRIRPYNISFTGKSLNKLLDAIKTQVSSGNGKLYLVPAISINMHTQNKQINVLKRIYATLIRPCSESSSPSTYAKRVTTGVNVLFTGQKNKSVLPIVYTNIIKSETQDDTKITTICDDGVVIRSGKYLFGLGFAKGINHDRSSGTRNAGYNQTSSSADNTFLQWEPYDSSTLNGEKYVDEPVLFFYDGDLAKKYEADSNKLSTDNEGFAKRINSIPISDIFECIKLIKQSGGILDRLNALENK